MPARTKKSSANGTICGDPLHTPLFWFPTKKELAEERASRESCTEPKIVKTRADGTHYTEHASSTTVRSGTALVPMDLGYKYPSLNTAAGTAMVAGNTVRGDWLQEATFKGSAVSTTAIEDHYQPAIATHMPVAKAAANPLYTTTDPSFSMPGAFTAIHPSTTKQYKPFKSSQSESFTTSCPAPVAHPKADSKTDSKRTTCPAPKALQPKAAATDPNGTPKSSKPVEKKVVLIATDPQSKVETRIERLDDGTIRTRKSWKPAAGESEVEDGWVDVGGKGTETKYAGKDDGDWTLL